MTAKTLEIHSMPGLLVRRLHQQSVSLFVEETSRRGYDLTPVQFAVLNAIEASPGLDQATLASTIAYDRVTIGGVVDRLVQKQWISRRVSARDKRARELHLTEAGRQTLTTLRPVIRAMQTKLLERLDTRERELFVGLLRKATGEISSV
jgi:DNA-binding MarR family transcriptional regulator